MTERFINDGLRLALAREMVGDHLDPRDVLTAAEAEELARTAVERLKNARDWAILGQRDAGQSLMKTAQALIKVPGWLKDIERYDSAVAVLAGASKVVKAAQQAVDKARAKVLADAESVELMRVFTFTGDTIGDIVIGGFFASHPWVWFIVYVVVVAHLTITAMSVSATSNPNRTLPPLFLLISTFSMTMKWSIAGSNITLE